MKIHSLCHKIKNTLNTAHIVLIKIMFISLYELYHKNRKETRYIYKDKVLFK